MTRVLITGDRNWYCIDVARLTVTRLKNRYGHDLVVVHGAQHGVDTAFGQACYEMNVEADPHPAEWDQYGDAAGPRRNQEMVNLGASFCIAVHRDLKNSRGTKDCVRKCLQVGIPVYLIDGENSEPKRIKTLASYQKSR